jgi:hypothetical protein
LFLRSLVTQGKSLKCINLQAAVERCHRFGQQLRAFWPLDPIRLFSESGTQVVLVSISVKT